MANVARSAPDRHSDLTYRSKKVASKRIQATPKMCLSVLENQADRHPRRSRKPQERLYVMKIRTACLGALVLTVLSGTAFAGALDEPTIMGAFYTDQAMQTMQSDEKMKVAWKRMSKENQAKVMKE